MLITVILITWVKLELATYTIQYLTCHDPTDMQRLSRQHICNTNTHREDKKDTFAKEKITQIKRFQL